MDAANQNQWADFWARLQARGDAAGHWCGLQSAYSESVRAYHNLVHIGHCLAEFADVKAAAKDPLAVEAAIWLHDVVYDTHSKDNEERSAEVAANIFTSGRLSPDFITRVRSLILATKHNHPPTGQDEMLLVDIDLAILGQAAERYARFEKEIRQEYAWVPAADFAVGRSAVLSNFLKRDRIYNTPKFVQRYEQQARENLAWAIERLRN